MKTNKYLKALSKFAKKDQNCMLFSCSFILGSSSKYRELYDLGNGYLHIGNSGTRANLDILWNMKDEKANHLRQTMLALAAAMQEAGDL